MLRGEAWQKSDLGGAGAIEGVGLQDVSAGLQELGVDVGNDIRAGDDQQVVVAPQLMRVLLVPVTPEVLLSQPEAAAHESVPYANPQQELWWKRLRTLYAELAFKQDTCVSNKLSKRMKYIVDAIDIIKQSMLKAAGNMNAMELQIL